MKNTLLILLLFWASISLGQDQAQQTNRSLLGTYLWTNSVILIPCNIDGTVNGITDQKITSIPDQYFKVIDEIKEVVIIEVLEYNKETENFYLYNVQGGSSAYSSLSALKKAAGEYPTKYFKVSVSVLLQHATQDIKTSFAFGVINFPFKYRPQPGRNDFSGAFNFGAGIGFKLPHKGYRKTTFSVINGYSISSINIDAASARRNATELESANNFTSLSISLGLLVENSKVQAGFFLGSDILSNLNQRQYGWHYQGKPWISIGFGYAIFSNEKAKENTSNTQPGNK
ncbi:hypothetical protein GCM10027347_59850 [Larkinella harenae]